MNKKFLSSHPCTVPHPRPSPRAMTLTRVSVLASCLEEEVTQASVKHLGFPDRNTDKGGNKEMSSN